MLTCVTNMGLGEPLQSGAGTLSAHEGGGFETRLAPNGPPAPIHTVHNVGLYYAK